MMSWIHMEDLCSIFIKAVEETGMTGAYNAVAPHPVTNRELMKGIAKVLNRPLWLPPVPSFVMHLLLGEMADIIVNGNDVSSARIEDTGFEFKFPELEGALQSLLK
jgi:NAD dependent epimerase/dehydratase family enzyme